MFAVPRVRRRTSAPSRAFVLRSSAFLGGVEAGRTYTAMVMEASPQSMVKKEAWSRGLWGEVGGQGVRIVTDTGRVDGGSE